MAYDVNNPKRRVYRTWNVRLGNSDTDDLPALTQLRKLGRDAYRNQPLVVSAINTKIYNTIGAGLVLQSTPNAEILGISPEEAAAWAKRVEAEFALWSESVDCDAERTKTFGEIQAVALIGALVSGDTPYMLPYIDRGGPYSLAVRLFEADRLCNPNNAPDTPKTAGGITVNEYGEPIKYHFAAIHPGGPIPPTKWITVPAYGEKTGRRNVYLLAKRLRPEQRRGVPILAPVLESLKVLDEYTTAELEAALVSGLFTVFVKKEGDGLGFGTGEDGESGESEDLRLQPGMMVDLNPGEDITTADPGRPNPNYDKFVEAVFKQVGAALNIPFEMLLKHFSASYSASRAALLEAWKAFKARRIWFARGFCQPIYEEFLWEAVLTGRIEAPGFVDDPLKRKAWARALWNGPAPGQLNPTVETEAAIQRVEAGFSTRTREAAEINGSDFEANAMAAKRENALIEEAGLKIIDNSKIKKGNE